MRDETNCEYDTGLLPDPRDDPPLRGARVPKVSSHVPGFTVLYRNQPVAMAPLGSPVPFSEAEVEDTEVADVVVATGAEGVVKVKTEPNEVPTALDAIAQ